MSEPTLEELRQLRRDEVRRVAHRVQQCEEALRLAIAIRDDVMIQVHGAKESGGLSYDEIAEEARISKGRVIQLVQNRSTYSRRQVRRKRQHAKGTG